MGSDDLTRRSLLQAVAAGAGLLGAGAAAGIPRVLAAPSAMRPRYFVQIFEFGGMDPIYGLDPKTRGEVHADVDIPYRTKKIIEAGNGRLGPFLRPIAHHQPNFSICRGVGVHTANHQTATRQIVSMQRGNYIKAPSLLDILGANRRGQPLGAIALGIEMGEAYSSNYLGFSRPKRFFSTLESSAPEELEAVAKVLRRQAARLGSQAASSGAAAQSLRNLEDIAALYEAMPRATKLTPSKLDDSKLDPSIVRSSRRALARFDRALWLLENDLVAAVRMTFSGPWDSHYWNEKLQTQAHQINMPCLDRFLEGLASRRNQYGRLIDQTMVVLSSEIGRHPKINDAFGKDHFPELPMLFFGGPLARGKYFGETAEWMQSKPIDVRTGRAVKNGHPLVLDDIGATLLHAWGLDPARWGYSGRVLPFLLS